MQAHRHCLCVPYFLRNQAENALGAITELEVLVLSFTGRALGAIFQVLLLQVWGFQSSQLGWLDKFLTFLRNSTTSLLSMLENVGILVTARSWAHQSLLMMSAIAGPEACSVGLPWASSANLQSMS